MGCGYRTGCEGTDDYGEPFRGPGVRAVSETRNGAPAHPTPIAVTVWYIDSHSCSRETVDGSWPQGKLALAMETFPGMVAYAGRCCRSTSITCWR